MQHILETNSDYVSDGFYKAWRDNIGERSEQERKKYKVYEIKSEEGTQSGLREELTAGMKFTPIYDVWNEEENTYDTEYGEEYTYKGENDFLYTILSEDEYSYAFIIEDASGYKMVSEMQKFSVIGQEVTLKTENE